MVYLQIGITILLQCFAFAYLKAEKKNEERNISNKEIAVALGSILLTVLVAVAARHKTENFAEYIKIMTLYQLLFCAAVVDAKKKIIPNLLIGFGGCIRVLCYGLEVFWLRLEPREMLLHDCLGVAAGAGVLLLVYLFSRQSIGLGDVKLFGIIGCYMGSSSTYTILFLSVLGSAMAAIYFVCVKKKKKNYNIAFAPFVLLGYFISVMFS